ncbi:MAG: 2-oxo acid dehydrogenase subunit E2 [Acidobacteria bacterium]|nr:2-oxo acid dehydrogenase subunit E2 [Acidobacteriota bacterium]
MPTKVIMPQMGESIAEGTVVKWLKKVGERVERDEPLLEISTDKVDAEIPSPASGVLTQILAVENQTVEVNAVIGWIDGEGAGAGESAGAATEKVAAVPARPERAPSAPGRTLSDLLPASGGVIRSSPLVQRLAVENDVDLRLVKGTGLGGRISKRDVLEYVAQRKTGTAPASPAVTAPVAPVSATQAITFTGPELVVPMTPIRRQIAEHMVASRRTSAHVSTVFDVEMTCIADVLTKYGDEFERRHGLKLTFTPFFIRACVTAIRDFPIINSSVDGTNIIYKRDVNVGVAVAMESGLIVPVIKNAGDKSFLDLARAVKDLAERARTKHLSVEDVQGGTFTISNPGVFGGLFGTPIINQPQVAILCVGAIEKRPVVRDDAIAIRLMTYLEMSFDHRVIDGAVANQFMSRLKSILDNWDEPVM